MYKHTLISIHLQQMKKTYEPGILFSEHFTATHTLCGMGLLLAMFRLCVYHHNLEREITINSIYLLIYFIILLFDHTFDLRVGHKFRTFT